MCFLFCFGFFWILFCDLKFSILLKIEEASFSVNFPQTENDHQTQPWVKMKSASATLRHLQETVISSTNCSYAPLMVITWVNLSPWNNWQHFITVFTKSIIKFPSKLAKVKFQLHLTAQHLTGTWRTMDSISTRLCNLRREVLQGLKGAVWALCLPQKEGELFHYIFSVLLISCLRLGFQSSTFSLKISHVLSHCLNPIVLFFWMLGACLSGSLITFSSCQSSVCCLVPSD